MRYVSRALGAAGAVLWRSHESDPGTLRAVLACGPGEGLLGRSRSANGLLAQAIAQGAPVAADGTERFTRRPADAFTEVAVIPYGGEEETSAWLAILASPPFEPVPEADAILQDACRLATGTTSVPLTPPDVTLTGGAAAFAMLLDLRDGYTGSHVDEVVRWCTTVGRELSLTDADLVVLRTAAQLHDLGKIGVPDDILHKAGALTDEEWRVMRRHSAWGADALAQVPGFDDVAAAVRGHHERWDGRGYPDGLRELEIPLASRVISVADAYHALISNRPYRQALSQDEARRQIDKGSGTQFDPEIAAVLLRVVPTGRARVRRATAASTRADAEDDGSAGKRRRRIADAIKRMQRFPALRESHERFAHLVETAAADQLVETIEADAALTLAVLRLASKRTPSRGVTGIPAALDATTPDDLALIVTHVPTVDFFQRVPGLSAPLEHFRLHGRATQRAARRVCVATERTDQDLVLVAALLHDIGKPVLEYAYTGYPASVHEGAMTPDDRLRAEHQALGVDHAAVGGLLLRQLGLPAPLAEAVERHHAPDATGPAAVLRLADMLAHYVHAAPVAPARMLDAARAAGLEAEQLRAIMFELSQDHAVRRALAPSPLTRGETAVLRGLAQGRVYKEIGQELGIAVSTVRSHCHSAYRKLDVSDRAQAVLKATENGWI